MQSLCVLKPLHAARHRLILVWPRSYRNARSSQKRDEQGTALVIGVTGPPAGMVRQPANERAQASGHSLQQRNRTELALPQAHARRYRMQLHCPTMVADDNN